MSFKNEHIIVADDDMVNLEIVVRNLAKAGYKNVVSFDDGDEIWEYLENNAEKINIVILDKMMPKMGGIEVMQRMQKHNILKNIPVIFQTADAEEHKIKQCLDAGAFACLSKPFPSKDLLEKLTAALSSNINNKPLQ